MWRVGVGISVEMGISVGLGGVLDLEGGRSCANVCVLMGGMGVELVVRVSWRRGIGNGGL